MSTKIVKMDPRDDGSNLGDILTPGELNEFNTLTRDPALIGFTLFDPDGEIFLAQDIEDMAAPVYANVFDMAERLGRELGQHSHRRLSFESGDLEVLCVRWSSSRLVTYRTKGGRR